MESITKWLHTAMVRPFPEADLSTLPGKPRGILKLTPEAILAAINGPTLAEWALRETQRFQPPRLAKGPGDGPVAIGTAASCSWRWCNPRTAIERHFAWAKRYFGLKDFQCFTLLLVMQFALWVYIAILAVALTATRYQRPELRRSRSMVIAHL